MKYQGDDTYDDRMCICQNSDTAIFLMIAQKEKLARVRLNQY